MWKPRISVLAALLAVSGATYAQAPPSAESLMKDAMAMAKKEKKAVWVIFHASW
jgi:hypothetical protein